MSVSISIRAHHVIEHAKRIMLSHGTHPPILYVENKQGKLGICTFEQMNEGEAAKYVFAAGRKHGQDYPEWDMTALHFVAESRISEHASIPAWINLDHLRCKEMLTILSMDVRSFVTVLNGYELIRDGAGRVIDLLEMIVARPVIDDLLTYFVAGVSSAALSTQEFVTLALHVQAEMEREP